jgi:hypothetical protein
MMRRDAIVEVTTLVSPTTQARRPLVTGVSLQTMA